MAGEAQGTLLCSLVEHWWGKCKDVAFFQMRDEFWSPKFGDLAILAGEGGQYG